MTRRPDPTAIWIALLAALSVCAAAGFAAPPGPEASGRDHSVYLIDIDGPISPAAADFIDSAISKARHDDAAALLIRLDTPGGLLSSAQSIVKSLLNAPLPIIVYVAPSGAAAASAGTFVVEAANVAAMAAGTTIGAAHPIEASGGEVQGVIGAKLENFTASFAQTIAQQRGRNEQWIQDAVRKSSSIGEREALKLHVIDIVAGNLADLLAQASGRTVKLADGRSITLALAGASVTPLTMTIGQRVLASLANPNIMYLLMIAGMLGLYFEFAHPGVYLPGVAGAICLLLALASFQLIPINLAGLLLLLLGAGMLVAEIFATSYGVLGIGGIISFVLGSLFLIDTSKSNLTVNRGIIAGVAVAFSAIVLGLGFIVIRGRRGHARTGAEGLVGEIGEVREPIAPGSPGRVFVHGESWRAVSDDALTTGARACITAVRGLEVVVRPHPARPS